MSNFIIEFKKGQTSQNMGIPLGLPRIQKKLNGIQKGRIYGFASAPKVGKSTFVDYAFLLEPYLYCLENKIPIEWIYFSFEMDRISKEFDFACYFFMKDYNITQYTLPEGVTRDGESVIRINSDLLRGRLLDDNDNPIKVSTELEEILKKIYYNRIIPLFGEYAENGVQIRQGKITFIEKRENPTGLWKFIKTHAELNGTTKRDEYGRFVSYTPNDSHKYTIVITDHLRKIVPERMFNKKETVDKYSEYTCELRNDYGYTFVHIIHLNRSLSDVERLKHFKEDIYPSSDDIKDTGNISEDCNYLFTLFNPNDGKYGLKSHFGLKLRNDEGAVYYENLRTIHLVESRHCEFPLHFRIEIDGASKSFKELTI